MNKTTKAELEGFENAIAELFNQGKIPYPVHLESGNEEELIKIFKEVGEDDYLFGSWRLHLKALLKGVSPDRLKAAIMNGHSMMLCFSENKIYGSSIVGGIVPIALGAALGIKNRAGNEKVWCFVGDMTAHTGIFLESLKYAEKFDLPIRFIIEDNGLSVTTQTSDVCGDLPVSYLITTYKYKSRYPHAGAGKRVQF